MNQRPQPCQNCINANLGLNVRNLGIRNLILLFFLTVLTGCEDSPQKADIEAISQLINETIADTELCLKDKVFRFPDLIVGSK
jgi:hypothetical protein